MEHFGKHFQKCISQIKGQVLHDLGQYISIFYELVLLRPSPTSVCIERKVSAFLPMASNPSSMLPENSLLMASSKVFLEIWKKGKLNTGYKLWNLEVSGIRILENNVRMKNLCVGYKANKAHEEIRHMYI